MEIGRMNYLEVDRRQVRVDDMSLKELQDIRASRLAKVDEVDKIIEQREKRTAVLCKDPYLRNGCGKGFEIGEAVYIIPQHYVSPHGCFGGDYWTDSDSHETECPHCGTKVRLHWLPEIKALKDRFKEVRREERR